MAEKRYGRANYSLAELLDSYADTLKKLNRTAEAEQAESRAKAIRDKVMHPTP
jgi:hypothetical protein